MWAAAAGHKRPDYSRIGVPRKDRDAAVAMGWPSPYRNGIPCARRPCAMIVSHEREKLINAVVFFAGETRYCGKIKLIKLLYLLDFEHFRQTGRSVTRMEYRAWRMGPVPLVLYQEWEEFGSDFAAAIDIVPEKVIDHTRETVKPKVAFDASHFSKRELRLMQDLVQRFYDDMSRPMVNVTHAEQGPWDAIWDGGRGNDARIPYRLAVREDDPQREAILESAAHYAALDAADARIH
jgi:uncharacterized phage-associated protein